MSKVKDIIQILIVVIIGILIPFVGSIIINFNMDITNVNNMIKIGSTFLWFLLIFGIELVIVYLYYQISNMISSKKFDELKPK